MEDCLSKVSSCLKIQDPSSDSACKLHKLILAASSACIQNQPTEGQKKRVREFVKAEKANRRKEKDKRSAVKRGRKSKGVID